MKKRNFINSLLQHTRRPDGFLGRMMLRGMNNGHAPLTRWGAAHIEWQPQWCVLDIGCGGGATLLRLLERCPDGMVCGVDASPESVEFSRRKTARYADRVHVERFRYIDRIATRRGDILQVSSEIAGRLPAGYEARMGDILFDMLPAGSVSGAPKSSTLRIIREAEGEPRGYYTGVFGYFDGQTLDSAVLIRFIEEEQGRMYFRSGGGITAYSDCRSEYEEVIEKVYLPFV